MARQILFRDVDIPRIRLPLLEHTETLTPALSGTTPSEGASQQVRRAIRYQLR